MGPKRVTGMSLFAFTLAAALASAPAIDDATKQLDFWVGRWTCTGKMRTASGKDQWMDTSATNRIEHVFKGHVIQEHFSMKGLQGTSLSVYDPNAKLWKQTWVDDSGSYIDLTGGWTDGKMTLTTLAKPHAPKFFARMVFENITKDSFDWNWEKSTDEGKTWELEWHLHYSRAK